MMTSSNGNIFHVTGPFVRGIHRSTVDSPHKCQWRGALMFSLLCAWTNGWANNLDAVDLRCQSHIGPLYMAEAHADLLYWLVYIEWEDSKLSGQCESCEVMDMMTSSNGKIFHVTGPFVRGIHRSMVDSPHKRQWRGALIFSLICALVMKSHGISVGSHVISESYKCGCP